MAVAGLTRTSLSALVPLTLAGGNIIGNVPTVMLLLAVLTPPAWIRTRSLFAVPVFNERLDA